jgi:hypothetical protein
MFAGSALDFKKSKTDATPEQTLGFLKRIASSARVKDQSLVATNMVPAIKGVEKYGGTLEEAAGLQSALTHIGTDITGAASGTAGVQLAKQLKEFFAKRKDLTSTDQRIKAIQADPRLFKKFFDGGQNGREKWAGASFEAKYDEGIRQMLSSDPASLPRKQYESSLASIGTMQQAEQDYRDYTGALEGSSAVQSERQTSSFDVAAEAILLSNKSSGSAARNREGIDKLLSAAGTPKIMRDLATTTFDAKVALGGVTPEQAGLDAIKTAQQQHEEQFRSKTSYSYGSGYGGSVQTIVSPGNQKTAADEETSKQLAALVKTLEQQTKALNENTKATQSNTQANQQAAGDTSGSTSRPERITLPDTTPSQNRPSAQLSGGR